MIGHSTSIILPTSYFPSINYFALIIEHKYVFIENKEYYIKQSLRNHTIISGPNENQKLTVPIQRKEKSKKIIQDLKIADNLWKKKHLQAIKTAYGNSPFFIHYFPQISELIKQDHSFLFQLNQNILKFFLKELEIKKTINYTNKYLQYYEKPYLDFRNQKLELSNAKPLYYQQTFKNTNNSLVNYSIIDLLFNLGNESKNAIISILKRTNNYI